MPIVRPIPNKTKVETLIETKKEDVAGQTPEMSAMQEQLDRLEQEKAGALAKLSHIQDVLQEKDNEILVLQRRIASTAENKSLICTVAGNGEIEVSYDGPWSWGDLRRAVVQINRGLRAHLVEYNREQLEESKDLNSENTNEPFDFDEKK